MPDTEIRELKSTNAELQFCPVLVIDGEGEEGNIVPCNAKLTPIQTTTIIGDDYGSWTVYDIYFPCGHTFDDMRKSFRYEGEI